MTMLSLRTLYLFVGACSLAALQAPDRSNAQSGAESYQLCWAIGAHDNTVYYAEIVNREDRSESFASSIDVSGIGHVGIRCETYSDASYHQKREALFDAWRRMGVELANTTFLSDLDF